jgi:CheY-like chemotaxis protein
MSGDSPRGTILVVEDNIHIRAFAKMLLENAGYFVASAADGEEGLRFYQEHRSRIVLLLTHVMMPKMNGLDLADRVLGIDSRLPIVLMSGNACGAYRGLECVPKPFRPAELLERVNRALHGSIPSERLAPAAQPC